MTVARFFTSARKNAVPVSAAVPSTTSRKAVSSPGFVESLFITSARHYAQKSFFAQAITDTPFQLLVIEMPVRPLNITPMKVATIIARVLLRLMFTVFGANIFLHFIPMPE